MFVMIEKLLLDDNDINSAIHRHRQLAKTELAVDVSSLLFSSELRVARLHPADFTTAGIVEPPCIMVEIDRKRPIRNRAGFRRFADMHNTSVHNVYQRVFMKMRLLA